MIGQGMLARKNIYRTGLIRKEKKKPIDKTQYTTRVFDLKEKMFRQCIKILTNEFKMIKHFIKIEFVERKMIIEIENKNKT